MKVIYGIGKAKNNFKNGIFVIGVFDGVHLGHQQLIKRAVRRAKKLKIKTYVMTFSPHPVRVLHQRRNLSYIVSLPYRLKLIEKLGVDGCLIVHFTKRFAHLKPENFIKRYLVGQIKPQEIFVGDDFRFGEDRKGTLEYFKKVGKIYGINVNGVHPVRGIQGKISSTNIRKFISEGRLKVVKKLLGRNYGIMGKVVKGKNIGKKLLGYPTANFKLQHETIPPIGVYAVNVIIGEKVFKGISNIGKRPSFTARNMYVNIETNIFGFKGNLYGKQIIVEFLKKIRNEKKFNSPQELKHQIKKDISKVNKLTKS